MKLIGIIGIFICGNLLGQHNDFQSLYMYDALTINPAYAGNKEALTLNANYRDQWKGIKGAPKTFSFSGHLVTRSKKMGLGLTLINDQYGIQNNLRFNLIYAYRIKIGNSILSFGVGAGLRNESVDYNALNLVQQDDIAFLNQSRRSILPDVNLGTMLKCKSLLVGISAPNIVRIKEKHILQAFNGYAGYVFDIGKQFKLKPTCLVKYLVHSPVSYEGNLTLYYKQLFSLGFGAKSSKTGNVYAQLHLNKQFGIAYLYERNLGPQGQLWRNTHEVMINYTFDYKTNVQSPRYL
ncbi:PorP/SprF family type IX secretion system membrane protein [Fluviicola sp.]|uniref:PorP/SprF family type IX secretion system membrane protein n=1 Tax=Fluviicola sp. TaxID=1917219 RepID=UPI0031CE8421